MPLHPSNLDVVKVNLIRLNPVAKTRGKVPKETEKANPHMVLDNKKVLKRAKARRNPEPRATPKVMKAKTKAKGKVSTAPVTPPTNPLSVLCLMAGMCFQPSSAYLCSWKRGRRSETCRIRS